MESLWYSDFMIVVKWRWNRYWIMSLLLSVACRSLAVNIFKFTCIITQWLVTFICFSEGMITLVQGNVTHNRRCSCDWTQNYVGYDGIIINPMYCYRKNCTNGTLLNNNGRFLFLASVFTVFLNTHYWGQCIVSVSIVCVWRLQNQVLCQYLRIQRWEGQRLGLKLSCTVATCLYI
jgi:hypothetical protein